jgi:hypothetical protein
MFIDEFAWLPDIVEKLEAKHHVSADEVEEVFFNSLNTGLSKQDIRPVKMYTRRRDRPTAGAT